MSDPAGSSSDSETSPFVVPAACALIVALVFLLLPGLQQSRESRGPQCKNQLKQIGLALHHYHDVYLGFPPASVSDKDGNPLHSWRVLILPYLGQRALFETIDLSKPWDDPVNAEAYRKTPTDFLCPSSELPDGYTSYVALVGEDKALHPTDVRPIRSIRDGLSSTVFVVEVPAARAVHWMAPTDSGLEELLNLDTQPNLTHRGGLNSLIGDGCVRFLSTSLTRQQRIALSTIAGDDDVGEF